MSASAYLANELLDHVFGGGDYTRPATLYISLHTDAPGGTGANEVSGASYARVAVTNNATNFPAASGGAKSNGTVISFATPGAGGWGEVDHVGIWDAASGGNFVAYGALAVAKTINEGDPVSFPIGDLDFSLT